MGTYFTFQIQQIAFFAVGVSFSHYCDTPLDSSPLPVLLSPGIRGGSQRHRNDMMLIL
jgi:hypothetical protein